MSQAFGFAVPSLPVATYTPEPQIEPISRPSIEALRGQLREAIKAKASTAKRCADAKAALAKFDGNFADTTRERHEARRAEEETRIYYQQRIQVHGGSESAVATEALGWGKPHPRRAWDDAKRHHEEVAERCEIAHAGREALEADEKVAEKEANQANADLERVIDHLEATKIQDLLTETKAVHADLYERVTVLAHLAGHFDDLMYRPGLEKRDPLLADLRNFLAEGMRGLPVRGEPFYPSADRTARIERALAPWNAAREALRHDASSPLPGGKE